MTGAAPAGRAGGPLAGVSRAVVLGAGGWFGRTAVDLLAGAWGGEAKERVSLFASRPRSIEAISSSGVWGPAAM